MRKSFLPYPVEPLFDELIRAPRPLVKKTIPGDRPARIYSFINRDEDHFRELQRLQNSISISTTGLQPKATAEHIVDWAVATGLVHFDEIEVAKLQEDKFLLHLPQGLVPDTFIRATPPTLWDRGVTFQPWTPLENASVNIPMFKVLLDLDGIPPHHFQEREVIRAVSNFGVFLGRVEAPEGNLHISTVVVAVHDLCMIPHVIIMVSGGLEHDVVVDPVNWQPGPIYKRSDLPSLPHIYTKPAEASLSSPVEEMSDAGEVIHMSRTTLMELCQGRDPSSLPVAVRAAMAGARSVAPQCTTMPRPQPQKILLRGTDSTGGQASQGGPRDESMDILLSLHGIDPVAGKKEESLKASNRSAHSRRPQKISTTAVSRPEADPLSGQRQNLPGSEFQRINAEINDKRLPLVTEPRKGNDVLADTGGSVAEAGRGTSKGRSRTPRATASPSQNITAANNGSRWKGLGPKGAIRKDKQVSSSTKGILTRVGQAHDATIRRRRKTMGPMMDCDNSGPSSGPSQNANKGVQGRDCQVNLDPKGFYNVQVQYSHCTDIAAGAGLSPSVVLETVEEDNQERQAQYLQVLGNYEQEDEERLQFPLTDEEFESDQMESDQD